MNHFLRPLLFSFLSGTVLIVCFIMSLSDHALMSIKGFAVDENGCLYLKGNQAIYRIDDTQNKSPVINKLPRGYAFTIVNGKWIHVYAPPAGYRYDLSGNYIIQVDDTDRTITRWPHYYTYTDVNGEKFTLRSILGYQYICREGTSEVIYRMEPSTYIMKVLLPISFLTFTISSISAIVKITRKSSNKTR